MRVAAFVIDQFTIFDIPNPNYFPASVVYVFLLVNSSAKFETNE
jgi:hypothetical protein